MPLMHGTRLGAHIEFENTWNHHDRLMSISIFEQREAKRFGTVDEKAAAKVLLVLSHPIAATVFPNEKKVRARRGRLLFAHGT